MATFLIYRDKTKSDSGAARNSSGINAVLVNGADEAAARAAAKAGRPTGETVIQPSWAAVQLASTELPAGFSPTYFEGDALPPGARTRGG